MTPAPRSAPRLVSVIVPAHDVRHVIDTQLAALARQDYPGAFEVIVADNNSTDGLEEHLRDHPLAGRLHLRVVPATEVQGAAHARNVGARHARGDLLAFCDGDDRVHDGWLSALVEGCLTHDACGGATETESINSELVQSWRHMLPPEQEYRLYGFLRVAPSGTFAVWCDAFEEVGGFDESFTRGGEDSDISIRLQLAGRTLGHAPKALIAYRQRTTLRGMWDQSVMCGEGDVRLYATYREHGMPRRPLIALIDTVLYLILRNPLLPQWLTRVPTGRWIFHAGNLVGRVRGSVQYRTYYV